MNQIKMMNIDKIIKITMITILIIVITDNIIYNNNKVIENNKLTEIQDNIQSHFHNWDNYISNDSNCAVKSRLVEEYVETDLGLTCYLAYSSNHVWDIICVDDVFYDFEATDLVFQPVSLDHDVFDLRHGFYIMGEKMHFCYEI